MRSRKGLLLPSMHLGRNLLCSLRMPSSFFFRAGDRIVAFTLQFIDPGLQFLDTE